ncbi:hypothetical protein [Nocardioides sp.]|uniref:hypothetical protein n=1 Tax=Nocardioides sp. TaxID=35761 RepID=UPI003D6C2221
MTVAALPILTACGTGPETPDRPAASESASAASSAEVLKPGTELSVAQADKLLQEALAAMPTGHVVVSQTPAATPPPDGDHYLGIEIEGDLVAESWHREAGEALGARTAYRVTGYRVAGTFDGDPVELVLQDGETYLHREGEWSSDGDARLLAQQMPNPVSALDFKLDPDPLATTTYVGKETIGGVLTDHYKNSAELEGQSPRFVRTDHLYLDGDGRLVRIRSEAPVYGTVTMDITAHGEPVTITRPEV